MYTDKKKDTLTVVEERGEGVSRAASMSSYLRAKFAFEAENDDEISFKKGEYLIVESVDADGEWVTGRIARKDGESKSGLFPMNILKKRCKRFKYPISKKLN